VPSSSIGFCVAKTYLDGDPVLLHGLQERGLGLRWRPVDLVRQDDVAEHRTRREDHFPTSRLGVFLDDVGAGDIRRHEVRRELDPRELEVHHLGDGVDQQGLGQAGHAHEQAVAADKKGEQDLLDDLLLAHDELPQLADDLLAPFLHAVGEGHVIRSLDLYRSDCVVHLGGSPCSQCVRAYTM
jgi:hypothetical protein